MSWGSGYKLQMSTLLLREPCPLSDKTLGFRAKPCWREDTSVCFEETKSILGYKNTKSSIFSTVLSQKFNALQVAW